MSAQPQAMPPYPRDLLELPRWIVWRYERRKGQKKPTKVPYNARTLEWASTTDPATWASFSTAWATYERTDGDYAGLGFVLGDGIVGVDFDGCRDRETGELEPWARDEIAQLNTYTEVSPSGTGVHLLARGTLPEGGRKRGPREVYAQDRFFTVTGRHLDDTPLELHDRTDALATWHAQVFARASSAQPAKNITAVSHDDERVIQRAARARNGARFLALFNGDVSAYRGDASAADMALVSMLRFYTQDAAQIDRIFRRSRLMREKWDERHYGDGTTYGEGTIRKALDEPHETAQPRGKRRAPEPVAADSPDHPRAPEPTTPLDDDALDAALLAFEADDDGNARATLLLYPDRFLYNPAFGWLTWADTHWQRVPEGIVGQFVIRAMTRRRIAGVRANTSKGESVIKVCKADGRRVAGALALLQIHVIEPSVDVFDADPDQLNCRNGVLHLRTGRIAPHDRSQRFTYCVPADYDAGADMSEWVNFIAEATCQNADVASYLQLCAGYSLTGHTREEKMFYLFGPPRAGKGTFTETLLALLPDPLSSEVDFNSFTARRDSDNQNFDLAELKPARVVFASESNRFQSLNPAKIKQMTGGNRIRCAFKHKDMFTYRPQFKVWLVSNWPVHADADDDALWGRVQVIEFPLSHLGMEDLTMKARLRANLAGVLRWAVEGARAWYAQGRLLPPEDVVTATKEHRAKQDYIGQWIEECCALRPGAWVSSASLMESYNQWCAANGLKALRSNEVAETLKARFDCFEKRQGHAGARGYVGIMLTAHYESGVSTNQVSANEKSGFKPTDGLSTVPSADMLTPADTKIGEVSITREEREIPPKEVSAGVSRQQEKSGFKPTEENCEHPTHAIHHLKSGVFACGFCGKAFANDPNAQ